MPGVGQLKRVARDRRLWRRRLLLFTDSLVSLGALTKGRSSGWPLLRLCREAAARRGSKKVISNKVSAKSKQDYEGSKLQLWNKSVASAKVLLGVRGFVPCGGPTLLGQRLKAQARQLYHEKLQQLAAVQN